MKDDDNEDVATDVLRGEDSDRLDDDTMLVEAVVVVADTVMEAGGVSPPYVHEPSVPRGILGP